MASEKITGASIFGSDVGQYFEKFINYTDRAKQEIDELRASIIALNSAMRGKRGLAELQAQVNQSMWQYARILKVTNKFEEQHVNQLLMANAATKALSKSQRTQVGTMRRMGMSLRSLLGAAGFGGLAFTIVQAGRSIFNYTKRLDSLNLALEKITESTYEFAEAKRFLSKMSDRLGLDLLKTAKSYTTFRAAAAQSNLTQAETNEIFESFADVGANLALTSSEMGSIFLALEQMLSKGKVSTEELRRQLGEKLPGAMGIMAEALGVTTGELDKMLRKGEVLTEDALPKFAEKVREVYGVDVLQRVETLQAAQNRLTNAWLHFVDLINNDGEGVGKVFITVLDTITEIVYYAEILADILGEQGPGSYGNVMTEAFRETWELVRDITDGVLRFSSLLGDFFSGGLFDIYDRYDKFSKNTGLDGEGGLTDGIKDDIAQRRAAIQQRKDRRERAQAVVELQRVTKLLNDEFGEEIVQQLELWELDKLSTEQIKEKINFINKQIISIEKQRKAIEESNKAQKEQAEDIPKDTINNIKIMYTQMDLLLHQQIKKNKEAAEELRKQIFLFPDDETAKEDLKKIEDEITDFYVRLGTVSKPSGDALEFYEQGRRRRTGEDTFDTAEQVPSLFGTDLSGDEEDTWERRLVFIRDGLNKVFEWESEIHRLRMQQLRAEDDALTEKYDRLFRLAEGDADMQERLRIRKEQDEDRLEAKRRKLEQDRAKAQKRQALAEIAINTAIAVSKVWGQTGIFGLAAQWPVLAMGAAQAAIVAATPLPEYAEGTDNHPGGLAVVGDGGREELVFTPDGKTYLTSDKPQIVDMPKGSQVIADAQEYIRNQTFKAIIETDKALNEAVVDKVAKAVQKGFRGVNMNTNTNVNVNIGHQLWRNKLINS